MKEKICALIRQTWFESAKNNLKPDERLAFYEACFNYEFYQIEPERDCPFTSVLVMFDMVKDSLEKDRQKAEMIAMRNRRNGMLGGRPKGVTTSNKTQENPDKTQENPDETQKTQAVNLGLPLHNTTQQNTTEILSLAAKNTEIEKEIIFYISLYFFANGATNAVAEGEKFYNYYQARGWQVGKGIPVSDKIALAKGWTIENQSSELIANRALYVDFITFCNIKDLEFIKSFVSFEIAGETAIFTMKGSNYCSDQIENVYLKKAHKWILARCKNLEYRVYTPQR